MPPSITNRIIEKLFLMLLAGSGSFGAYYLKNIDTSLTDMSVKMGSVESTLKYTVDELSYHRSLLNQHELRLDSLGAHYGEKK